MGSSVKAEKKAKKEKKDKKDKKEAKSDAGKKDASKKTAAAAAQPMGKAAKKKALLDWFHGALKADTDGARADFLKARDYVAVANVIRKHARDPKLKGAHADAIKLLDNKGHFLNIVDVVVKDGAADASTHWDKVKAHHRAKFEKAGGKDGVAEKKRAAREAKEAFKVLQKERAEREAKQKELAADRKEYRQKMDEVRLKGACLDWCNLGKCKFGDECQFKHPDELKGTLVALANKIKAKDVGGKKGKEREETERRKKRKAAKKEKERDGEGGGDTDSDSDTDDGGGGVSESEDSFDRAGKAEDDYDSEDFDSDLDVDVDKSTGAKTKRKKRKDKVLSVLPGDDGSDSDGDDEDLPRMVRLRKQKQREEAEWAKAERAAKKAKQAKILEKVKAARAAKGLEMPKRQGSRDRSGGRGGGGRGGGGGGGRGGGRGGRGGRGEKRSFDGQASGEKRKKKPRHADGRHAKHAAAHAARTAA